MSSGTPDHEDVSIADSATVGVSYTQDSSPPVLGGEGTVRAGTIIYDDVSAESGLITGHHALIRELTTIGRNVLVGTQAVIDGRSELGDEVRLQTGAYVPTNSTLHERVFMGPNATLLNDDYPLRQETEIVGPTLKRDVTVGANATILPGVTVGEQSFVAAGAVVTQDVPPDSLAVGVPAAIEPLPKPLKTENNI